MASSLRKIDQKQFKHIKNLPNIYFDGAHNPAGAYILSQWLKKNKKNNLVIYGATMKHNHDQFLQHLNDNDICFVEVKNEPNQETIFNFKQFLQKYPQYNIKFIKI